MFAHTNDDKVKTTDFTMISLPKFCVTNDVKRRSELTSVSKVVYPLSERFANEKSCLLDPSLVVSVQLLTSDVKRHVHIEKKPADNESARQDVVASCRKILERTKEELKKKGCPVDTRLTKSKLINKAKQELDLPLPKFAFAGKTLTDMHTQRPIDTIIGVGREAEVAVNNGDKKQSIRSSMMESLLCSISLLDVLTDNEFGDFCYKLQQDIDTAVFKHHIARSDS